MRFGTLRVHFDGVRTFSKTTLSIMTITTMELTTTTFVIITFGIVIINTTALSISLKTGHSA